MHGVRRWRPSPAMVVALIALFVALGGSVYAASKIDGRTIEKRSLPGNRIVADSVRGTEVDEGTLSQVPNAAALDGIDSTAFGRVASSGIPVNAIPAPSGGTGTARAVTISAPRNGFLMAVASASVFNENDVDDYTCFLGIDGANTRQSQRPGRVDFSSFDKGICDTNEVFPVSKGRHEVKFNFDGLDNTTVVDAAELDVAFIPFRR